ncbi:MAG: radical SAM/SPASM domain-containing protein [Elusimicrobiota bacterium]
MTEISVKTAIHRLIDRYPVTRSWLAGYRKWRLALESRERREISARPWQLFDIELTNKCPFSCVMCARTNNMTREQGNMSFDTFKAVIDQYVAVNPLAAATRGTFLHHFGESLVHPEFGRFIRYAVSKGLTRASMSINPLMLTPSIARELLESGIYSLNVSLDGHDDESFFKIRGVPNAYEKSKVNLLAFLKMKVDLGSKTIIHLGMIDFAMNRESIDRQKTYWENLPGIDYFRIKELRLWDGSAADVNRLAPKRVDNSVLRATNKVVSCSVPWDQISVAWDGDVVPCCYDYDKKYVLGNVHKQPLNEIWNGERMRALRKEFISNDVSNPLCRNCPELYVPPTNEDAPLRAVEQSAAPVS